LLLLLPCGLPVVASELVCPSMDVFVREGCPHCADAKVYLQQLQQRYPDLNIRYHEVSSDPQALRRLLGLSRQYGVEQPGVPSFLVCDEFYAGFSVAAGSTDWIEGQLLNPGAGPQPYLVRTPFGEFSLDALGLPVFTLTLGLIDGFNPCAMWVLLFLLSILVNIRNRRRIILIAGTFVAVSGLVYFAFMAAWLNLFLLIGFARWLQIAIGILALAIGAVHLKDFIAFGKGVSLSISDSVKPTLYARVRNIMHAPSIWAALVGVTIVAIMVNMVELLCTAGLPALYTQLLSLKSMSAMQYYGYLALYNLAYIFDDALMVTITVFTMNRLKLQEKQGRWLKLISGLVIFTLGFILLAAPGMLI
jgi:glutaredoxin